MRDKSQSQKEILRFTLFLERLFNTKFEFLNKEEINEEEICDRFKEDRVVFEDLEGNPMQLQHLTNLSALLANSNRNRNEMPKYKSLFNLKSVRPWLTKEYHQYYLKKFVKDKIFKILFTNHACLLDGKFEIRGVSKSNIESHIKVLRVTRHSKCILKSSNKLKISELISDPRFKDSYKSAEATYLFPYGEFNVKWENCFNVFDWPDLNADCYIEIKLNPDTMISSIANVKSELQQLKILLSAVEEDLSSWSLIDNRHSSLTVDQFKLQLSTLLQNKGKLNGNIDKTTTPIFGNDCVSRRETDVTEDLWTLFKNIPSKMVYKQCIASMMPIFQENISKVKLNPSNKTEFYRMLSERYLKAESKVVSFMTSIDLLVELGLHKVTKDLISVISEEIIDLTQDDMSDIFTKCCIVDDLHKGVSNLKNFFNCVMFLEILKDLLNPPDFRKTSITYIRMFIDSLSSNSDFDVHQSFTVKMRAVNPKLRLLSALWIINFESNYPINNEKAVIFETEYDNDEFQVFRHDIDLADVRMFD